MSYRSRRSSLGLAVALACATAGCEVGQSESDRVVRPSARAEAPAPQPPSEAERSAEPNEAAPESSEPAEPGVVEGRVIYHADPGRFWRYGRYYVKNKENGWLAETVVALKGDDLVDEAEVRESATATMDQQNLLYIPETLVIRAGDRVKFLNNDPPTHNVSSSGEPHRFDVTLPFGGEAVETFPKAGGTARPVQIGCKFHSSMRAWIYVFDHPYFALTGEEGKFRFDNVPPGSRRLEVVHPAGGLRWSKEIDVEPGGTTTVEVHLSPDNQRGS